MKQVAKLILWLIGWNITISNQRILTEKKYLLIAAPHTSSWDFIIGKLVYLALGKPSKFFIKQESFKWPLKRLLLSLGGIPINRKDPREAVKIRNRLKEEEMIIILTPEGTRKATNRWQNGFYSIAKGVKVPVFIGVLDYGHKVCRFEQEFVITTDFETDMQQLLSVYYCSQAKYPDEFKRHGEI
jgi:1-acyl-sn-glycerol-3-phosphate acyltransferase